MWFLGNYLKSDLFFRGVLTNHKYAFRKLLLPVCVTEIFGSRVLCLTSRPSNGPSNPTPVSSSDSIDF